MLKANDAIYYLAAIVESSQDSIITINFEGIITSWNQAAQEVYGYSADEAIGQPLTMLTLPSDLAEVLHNNERVRHNRRVEMFETVRVNKDGRHTDLEIVMSPVKDVAGEVIGISIIARDITDRKEAELAQREREELRRLEEARGELVWRIVKTQEEECGRIARVARQSGPAPDRSDVWPEKPRNPNRSSDGRQTPTGNHPT